MNRFIRMLWRIVPVGFSLISCLGFFAAQAFGLDLLTALALAEQNDADFKAGIMEARAKNAGGWSQIASLGPRAMVTAKGMRSRLDYTPDGKSGIEGRDLSFNDNEITLSLDQPLLDMEKISRARKGAREMDIATMEQVKEREDLIVRVIERYFSLLSARDEVDLINSKLQFLASQLETAQAGHELGLGDQSDLFDVQARFKTTMATRALLRAKLVDAEEDLVELLGVPVEEVLERPDIEKVFTPPENDIDYWLKLAEEKNINCRISRMKAEAARMDGMIAAGRFLPALSFFVEYERANPENDVIGYGWDRERTDYGLKLQMQFLSGGSDVADMVAFKRRYRASKQLVIATHRSIIRQTKSTWSSLQETLETIQLYEQAVTANKQSLQIKEAGYQEGLQTMLDVLNVQKDYFSARNKYQNARYDYVVIWSKFKQLIGDLTDIGKHLTQEKKLLTSDSAGG